MKMNKIAAVALLVATAGASVAAAAAEAHPLYVRGQIGFARPYNVDGSTIVNSTHLKASKKVELAGRVAGGYQLNDTFSGELGYTQFSKDRASVKTGGVRTGRLDNNAHAVDALIKASLPVTDTVSVFGGAGAAYYTVKHSLTDAGLTGGQKVSHTNSAIRPEFTLGSSYKLNENTAIDASYTQIIGKGSAKELSNVRHSKYMPDAQMLAVGVNYSF